MKDKFQLFAGHLECEMQDNVGQIHAKFCQIFQIVKKSFCKIRPPLPLTVFQLHKEEHFLNDTQFVLRGL